MISRNTARNLGYDFHGGQGSHLYSFASTGGVLWSEDHRRGCRREIRGHMRWAIQWLRDASKGSSASPQSVKEEQRNLRLARKLDAYLAKAKVSKVPYPQGILSGTRRNPGYEFTTPGQVRKAFRQGLVPRSSTGWSKDAYAAFVDREFEDFIDMLFKDGLISEKLAMTVTI